MRACLPDHRVEECFDGALVPLTEGFSRPGKARALPSRTIGCLWLRWKWALRGAGRRCASRRDGPTPRHPFPDAANGLALVVDQRRLNAGDQAPHGLGGNV